MARKKKMTLEELKVGLWEINRDFGVDPETAHCHADDLLIEYIGNDDVRKLFDDIEKWYA